MAALTLYRLIGVDIFDRENWKDLFIEADAVTEVKLKSGIDARLFLSRSHARAPKWVGYLEQITKRPLPVTKQEATGAVLLVKPDLRKKIAYAATWGTGHFLLRHDHIQADLGLRSALNLLADHGEGDEEWNPERVRAVRTKRVGATTLISQIQASRKTSVDSFPISLDADHLRQVTGTPSDPETWGPTITGSISLHVRRPEQANEIRALCKQVEKVYHSEHYKEKYGWIDNVAFVTDKVLQRRAISAVIEQLKSRNTIGLSFAPPTIVEWENVDHFEFQWGNDKIEHPEPSIEDLVEFLLNQSEMENLSHDILETKGKVRTVNAEGETTGAWTLLKCIAAEFTLDGKTYILDEGTLFLVSDDYLSDLKGFVDRIPQLSVDLPKTKNRENEGPYNERLAQALNGAILLDKKTIRRLHASAVEICDLALTSKHLIHVKKGLSSSSLSHLFSQGVVSAELLHMDENFREKVAQLLSAFNGSTVRSATDFNWLCCSPFQTGGCEVAYVIMAGREVSKASEMLPFFSKVNLRQRCHELRRMGFSYSLSLVSPR